MKKRISILLLLAMLLSLCSCTFKTEIVVPQMPTKPAATEPTEPTEGESSESVVLPDLQGQQVHKLEQSEDYTVQISQKIENTAYAEGTILGQAPVGGTQAKKGTIIYVIVTTGGPEDPIPTEAPTEPSPTDAPTEPRPTSPPTERPTEPEPTRPPTQPPTEPEPTTPPTQAPTEPQPTEPTLPYLDPNGVYTSKEDVALYIVLYKRLPNNFVTKSRAEDLYNWNGGSLSKYGKCIGGDRFYNNEGRLPSGYTYYECDIDTLYSSKRGSKRLVFTYSGIVYYTSDHYKTFTRLY